MTCWGWDSWISILANHSFVRGGRVRNLPANIYYIISQNKHQSATTRGLWWTPFPEWRPWVLSLTVKTPSQQSQEIVGSFGLNAKLNNSYISTTNSKKLKNTIIFILNHFESCCKYTLHYKIIEKYKFIWNSSLILFYSV